MPQKIDGRAIAERIKTNVKEQMKALKMTPGITAVLVGDNPASHLYVSIKEKECVSLGIHFDKLVFPETITQDELLQEIKKLNQKQSVNAILVQMPLPSHINPDIIIACIAPEKDVDGFQPGNPHVKPVLLKAVAEILKNTEEKFENKMAVVVCNSNVFCDSIKGLEQIFGFSMSCVNARELEKNLASLGQADVIIVAAGIPNLITAKMVKDNVVIVDIGTNKTQNGLVGDVVQEAYQKSLFYTPVPGGVGPVTVACLLQNMIELAGRNFIERGTEHRGALFTE